MSCLQLQAKLVAVIEIVVSCLLLLFFVFAGSVIVIKKGALIEALNKLPEDEDHPHLRKLLEASIWDQISLFVVPICYFITELGLGILLYRSILKLNHKRLRLWFIITTTLMAMGVIFFVAEVLRHEDYWDVIVVFVVNFGFSAYSLWVVFSLIREIKVGGVRLPVPYHNGFYKL